MLEKIDVAALETLLDENPDYVLNMSQAEITAMLDSDPDYLEYLENETLTTQAEMDAWADEEERKGLPETTPYYSDELDGDGNCQIIRENDDPVYYFQRCGDVQKLGLAIRFSDNSNMSTTACLKEFWACIMLAAGRIDNAHFKTHTGYKCHSVKFTNSEVRNYKRFIEI